MQKAYDHHQFEDELYNKWESSGKMRARSDSEKPAFTIPLPPPNVTGQLHLGHAAMLAIEDIMIRYKKMTGHEALWIPGTDHAAIATENVVIKHHKKKSREEWGSREAFLSDCREFAADKHDMIVNQMKKMGAWLDWSREAYTFDDTRNHAVNTMFKMLYEDGLIERGYRMINWSVGAQSVLSDDELEWEEQKEPFYYIRCGEFLIGTVRSETKCADSPVVVHPDGEYVRVKYLPKEGKAETFVFAKVLFEDKERLKKTLNLLDGEFELIEIIKGSELVGQEFEYDTYAGKRKFVVLADDVIDMEKGTGSMTISVNHSGDDYSIAQKHGLKKFYIEKLDFNGKMTKVAGPCEGMPVAKARKEAGRIMEEMGLLVGKDESYLHKVPLCYRSDTVVEPMISPQWFILVNKEFTDRHTGEKTTLKKQMQEAVRGNHVKIIPERFNKEYFRWIDNLQDWCISRQIWWGHRIPVWYDKEDNIHLPKEQKMVFVRHGESIGNAKGLIQFAEDELTEKGEKQAFDTAQKLQEKNITKIISSPAERAKKTAEIIAQEIGFEGEIEYWEEFKDADYGDLKGQPKPTDMTAMEKAESMKTGEGRQIVFDRVRSGWEKLSAVNEEGEILVVSHRTIFSALDAVRESKGADVVVKNRAANEGRPHDIWGEYTTLVPPKGKHFRQDEDTLDTWFSSALWPFSTLGWPDKDSIDLSKFYQNDVLETGWDILFFWVARMIMFGRYALGEYPFHTVYLHGMVCDEHGKKMSKSKGNGIDPLEMIDEVGADAVRLSLVIGSSPGNPIPIGKNKIKGYRNFANKLWNAGRFVQMQIEQNLGGRVDALEIDQEGLYTSDAWILSRLSVVSGEVKKALEKYEISLAGDIIYHFVWDEFCDWYVETVKGAADKKVSTHILYYVFGEILKLVHPMCPFVTETLWGQLYDQDTLLIDQDFPKGGFKNIDAERAFGLFQSIIGEVRKVRTDHGINPKDRLNISLVIRDSIPVDDELALRQNISVLQILAQLGDAQFLSESPDIEHVVKVVLEDIDVYIEIPFDEEKEKERIQKERESLEKSIGGLEGRLANKSYTEKAPEHLVNETREQLRIAKEKLENLNK